VLLKHVSHDFVPGPIRTGGVPGGIKRHRGNS
jgi:hypothetical protein